MKKTLLSIFSVALGFSLNAQTYFEDFSGGLGQFTSIDADGMTLMSGKLMTMVMDKETLQLLHLGLVRL